MGVTQAAGAGAGIKGQLGFGPAAADPTTWTWVDATYNKDTGSGANDGTDDTGDAVALAPAVDCQGLI